MEIGFAAAHKIPIFTADEIFEPKIRAMARRLDGIWSCPRYIDNHPADRAISLLINPHDSLELVRDSLDRIEAAVRKANSLQSPDASIEIYSECRAAASALRLPTV